MSFAAFFMSSRNASLDPEEALLDNSDNRELKQITTTAATRTSPNRRFNEQNNSCARAL